MTVHIWQTLIGNFASVGLIISLWMHVSYRFYRLSQTQIGLGFAFTIGACMATTMLLSVELVSGLYFDLRASLLVFSAVFGGLPALAVSLAVALALRTLMGGSGMMLGLEGICIIACFSLLACLSAPNFFRRVPGLFLLAGLVAILSVGILALLPPDLFRFAFAHIALPNALLNFFAIVLAGLVMGYFHRFTLERDVLRAALTQAPDFHYVKDRASRFVVANLNVAHHNGRQRPDEMIGLSDFDLVSAERAATLRENERRIIETGIPILDMEESVVGGDGASKWFTTTKVALKDRQGGIVGLAGVTRDITHRRRLEEQLLSSRNLLSQAMAEMSDGLAMFDAKGRLVFCNDQYHGFFPRSAHARVPGTHISDILRAVIRTGERKDVESTASEDWVSSAALRLHANKDEEIPLFDDRWLSVRTRLAQDGSSLVVVSDITTMKQSEQSLKQLADHMKGLAQTDSLTGLANRRTFDETIARECSRSFRSGAPLTLLLVDVDRFKSFNDTYGHPAGDACLKQVSTCLLKIARRTSDLVSRYGGEEFAVLLPETALDVAIDLADTFRGHLADLTLEHRGSETGIVTASVGVASIAGSNAFLNPAELISMADASLYRAKQNGRNRTEAAAS